MKHLTTILDKVASELEARGLKKLAAEIDVVTNTLEKDSAYGMGQPIPFYNKDPNAAPHAVMNGGYQKPEKPVEGQTYSASQVQSMEHANLLDDTPLVITDPAKAGLNDPGAESIDPRWLTKLPQHAKLKYLHTTHEKFPVFELMDKNLAHLVVKK